MVLRDAIEAYLDGDRDLELRRESAKKHAESAKESAQKVLAKKTATAAGDQEEEDLRTNALSEVGKALALDPDNKEALGTLVSLLTSPPRFIPSDIRVQHAEAFKRNLRRAGIIAAVIYGYISLNALSTMRLGVHNTGIFWTAHILWALAFFSSILTIFRPSYFALLLTFFWGITTSTYITTVYGPYILVSTLITMHAVLFAFVRDWKPRIAVIAASCVAWTVSVFGEALGIFPQTIRFVEGDMVIHSNVINLPPTTTTIYLYASLLATILFPALVVGALRTAYDRAEMKMRLQSWQLRRLVSDGTAGPGSSRSGSTAVVKKSSESGK